MEKQELLVPVSIDINDAKNWTKEWRNKRSTSAKAFLIPVDDLVTILKEMSVLMDDKNGKYTLNNVRQSGIRAYMAINPDQKEANGEKLLLVGTVLKDGIHRDIVQDEKDTGKDKVDPIGSGVYDFTSPCPSECDVDSPLF